MSVIFQRQLTEPPPPTGDGSLHHELPPPTGDGSLHHEPISPTGDGSLHHEPPPPTGDGSLHHELPPPTGEGSLHHEPISPTGDGSLHHELPPPTGDGFLHHEPPPPTGNGSLHHEPPPPTGDGSLYHEPISPTKDGSLHHELPPPTGDGSLHHEPPPCTGDGSLHHEPSPSTGDGSLHHEPPPPTKDGSLHHELPPPTGDGSIHHEAPPPADAFSSLLCGLTERDLGQFRLVLHTDTKLVYASFYDGATPTVKIAVTVNIDGDITVSVHNRQLPLNHELWDYLPKVGSIVSYMKCLLQRIQRYSVCVGNCDEDMVNLTPIGSALTLPNSVGLGAYREGNFNATCGNMNYSSTIRHTDCTLLVEGARCAKCRRVRDALRARRNRARQRSSDLNKFTPNQLLTPEERDTKLKMLAVSRKSLKRRVLVLEDQVEKLRAQLKARIEKEGESLTDLNNADMLAMMKDNSSHIRKVFGENSFQRIFFEQQLKYNELRSKKGMRWHPSIVRWCLYLRSKSAKAYDGMRHLLALPSERTLFDYSNATESGSGYKYSVTKQLIAEAKKLNLYDVDHTKYVGVVQDEVRVKSDLVFNKHTGELVGFVDLDNVGNELLQLEQSLQDNEQAVARYMLVVMVRGVTSRLQYPLAAFATDGITADFLYPIIWQAVEIIHTEAQLNVLFVCCDGASPNRKFFSLHSVNANSTLYKTRNPFSEDDEDLYFISDAPHLLKTTRNCFSNSEQHKRSRILWNGGNISWRHIVRLFEEHCQGAFKLCNKLTEQHVYLTSFTVMKVNLAAQVLSNNVARALEHSYDVNEVGKTVEFIDVINKWFDIMNSRSLFEAQRKRNVNVAPISDSADPRLCWLLGPFLDYFQNWANNINQRYPNFTKSEKAAMQLSHQTLNGLTITTKSVVECTRFLLAKGAAFVMTEHFSQDPLERHFGHYRQKGGLNENPTVWQVCHTLNQVRTVKCQGLAPRRGNIQANLLDALDDTPLPRRRLNTA